MNHRPIDLQPLAIEPGSESDEFAPYRLGGIFLAGAAAQALAMCVIEDDLPRRARAVATLSSVATLAVGAWTAVRPSRFARLVTRQRGRAVALPLAGVASLWASYPRRSPMFFPLMFLTAAGAARVGTRTGTILGASTSALYVGGVVVSQRRDLRDRRLLWNAGVSAGFTTAGYVGPLLFRVAFAIRTLDHNRRRDRELVDPSIPTVRELRDRAERVSAAARAIDGAVARVQRIEMPTGEAQDRWRELTDELRARAVAYSVAPLLLSAARGETLGLDTVLHNIVMSHRHAQAGASILYASALPADFAADGRATAAAVKVLQNALANAFQHGGAPRNQVRVAVRERADILSIEVADCGGGTAPPTAQFGHGLRAARASCMRLGGNLHADQLSDGVRVVATIPCTRSSAATSQNSVLAQADQVADSIGRVQAVNLWWQGLCCLATAESATSAMGAVAALSVISALEVRGGRIPDQSPWRVSGYAASASLLWPRGGLPPSGWVGNLLLLYGVGSPRRIAGPTAAATLASAVAAWRVRSSVERSRVYENLLFPPLCAVMGLSAGAFARGRLAKVESESGSLRERASLVEEATDAAAVWHDLVKPLRGVPGWHTTLKTQPEVRELLGLARDATELMRDLSLRVAPVDPLEEFQRYIATLLAPIPVSVSGELPERDGANVEQRFRDVRELSGDGARAGLGLIALADAVAVDILDAYPVNLWGGWSLKSVHIDVSLLPQVGNESPTVRMVVQPLPVQETRNGNIARMHEALSRIPGGHLLEGIDSSRRTFDMAAEVLMAQAAKR